MVIVNIINSILQAMVDDPDCELKSWQYNDLSTSNVRLDNKKPSPTAVFLQISDWTLGANALNVKESADINISFLEKEGKLDAGGIEQDQIIDRMKALAIDFIQRLKNVSALKIEDDEYKIKSVFLRSDSNRSGVNLQLAVKERQGECINGTYDPVMTVTENGLYNVAGYTQIIVDLPECPVCPDPPTPPTPPVPPEDYNFLCFTALENDSSVTTPNGVGSYTFYWSYDKENWYSLGDYDTVELPYIGDKVYFYGNNDGALSGFRFGGTGKLAASGDVTTLLSAQGNATRLPIRSFAGVFSGITALVSAENLLLPTASLSYGCYDSMFKDCTGLVTPPALPATGLDDSCYHQMFSGCTSLTTAPALPAETLVVQCYYQMFADCTSLTTAPEIPATKLASNCCGFMFQGCTSLTTPPTTLPAMTLVGGCYYGMFRGCTALTTAPTLPATMLAGNCYGAMFEGCTSLTTAPELPARELPDFCYTGMFYNCASLTTAPTTIPATTIGIDSCQEMFSGCTSLTTAPTLPVTTLGVQSYWSMFKGCTSLTAAPALPATTLAGGCYKEMFSGCTSLTSAPALPATTLADYCYSSMFSGCTSLTTAPAVLPATTLAYACYQEMFKGCTSLTTAPELPAPTLVDVCYKEMFYGCSSLSRITCLATTRNHQALYPTTDWVRGVAAEGTFIKSPDVDWYWWGRNNNGIPRGWTLINYNDRNYLCFTANEVNSTVSMTNMRSHQSQELPTIYVSTDKLTWTQWDFSAITLTNVGDKVYMYGSNPDGFSRWNTEYNYSTFQMTGSISASGNVTTLIDRDGVLSLPIRCFLNLFQNCTSLTSAPELPATTLADRCYKHMFQGCTSLTTAPALPATTLATSCYQNMFEGCTSLTTAPALPATTLYELCYTNMFRGCTSLTEAPELPVTTLTDYCYNSMFRGCTSLTSAPELPATTLAASCYTGMFNGCTSLTTAPELPATTVVNDCYNGMFQDCTSLNYIKVGATSWARSTAWVYGVSPTGTFEKPSALTNILIDDISGIPSGWTVINY